MSEALHALHFQQPLWLALVLLPWLLHGWRRRRAASPRLTIFADAHLLPRLLVGRPGAAPSLVFALAFSLAALAAAGPYWSKAVTPAETRGVDLAVIVDISPSMAVADLAPTRLARVQRELRDFTRLLGGDRLALVVFSGNAYPALPLTGDRDAFLQFVDLLDPGLTTRPGSNLARAVEVAIRTLGASPRGSRAVLLISDGEFHDNELASAAAALRAEGLPLLALGAATAHGGPVPDAAGHFLRHDGEVVISRLDRTRLAEFAQTTGGAYTELAEDDGDWRALLAALRERTQAASRADTAVTADAVPLYAWPLAASLVLFLWAGAPRREALALVLLPLLIAPPPAAAAPWTESRAYEALQQGDFRAAQRLYGDATSYAGAMGAGAAAYRLEDYEAALAAFERAARRVPAGDARADALYNAGNALARLGRYADASARYQDALRLVPNFNKAALNLSLVNEFLDARRGRRPADDNNERAAGTGATRRDARDSASTGRGDDVRLPSSAAPAAAANPQQQTRAGAGAATPAQTPSATPPRDAELRRTLAQWRDARTPGGDAAEIEALRDNNAAFLRWRFQKDDFGPHVKMMEGKPW